MARSVARTGILWTGLERVLVYGITFVQGVILARLLGPEDFGLAAMLGIFLSVGAMFAESGLGAAYVVYGGGLRHVWRWNVGMALGVYGVLALAAPAIAAFYRQPVLRELTWIMGLGIVLNAASVAGGACLQRTKRFAALSVINSVAALSSTAVGVAMAWRGFGVWSLAGVGLSFGAVRLAVLAVVVGGGSAKIEEGSGSLRQLLDYGWKATASGLIHVVYVNLAQLVIGRCFSPVALGLYARGHRWAMLPGGVVNESVSRVALPAIVEKREKSERWVWVNCGLLWPGLAVLWIWAGEIVGLVLGAAWLDCVPYLRIILVGQFMTPFSNLALTRLKAAGRTDLILRTDFIKKPVGLVALAAGLPFGVAGLCWAKVVDDVVEAVVDWAYVAKAWKGNR